MLLKHALSLKSLHFFNAPESEALGLVGHLWGTISNDPVHNTYQTIGNISSQVENPKCMSVQVLVIHMIAQSCLVMCTQWGLKVWLKECANRADRLLCQTASPSASALSFLFVRHYLQEVASSWRQRASSGTQRVWSFFGIHVQKVVILPRLAATYGSLNGECLNGISVAFSFLLPWSSHIQRVSQWHFSQLGS